MKPFSWYGSSASITDVLLPLLRWDHRHHYVEPFGGCGAVLMARERAAMETFNEVDEQVTNFFRVLRKSPRELYREVSQTPYSREAFNRAMEGMSDPSNTDLERARCFFVSANQSWPMELPSQTSRGTWRRNIQHTKSAVGEYRKWVEDLPEVAERFKTVQVENKDALDIIADYDTDTTLFYIDPPYINGTDNYGHQFDIERHRELVDSIKRIDARVALSGTRSEEYAEWLSDWSVAMTPNRRGAKDTIECVWMNYNPSPRTLPDGVRIINRI